MAALLSVRDAQGYVMIRVGNAGGRWTGCSPVIIERTMSALHAQGCRSFDFSIGNYDYKRRLGVSPVPLYDYTEALGVAGVPMMVRARGGRAAQAAGTEPPGARRDGAVRQGAGVRRLPPRPLPQAG